VPKPVELCYWCGAWHSTSVAPDDLRVSPGDKTSRGVPTTRGAWQQGVIRQVIAPKTVGLRAA